MKLTESNFQVLVKAGALLLAVSTVGNVYLLLRHREVYRDASQIEVAVQQVGVRQAMLEGVVREFLARSATDPGIAQVFQRARTPKSTNAVPTGVNP